MSNSCACPSCRDCGVFPGTLTGTWASCICEAGRLRCTQGSDLPRLRPGEDEIETHYEAFVIAFEELYGALEARSEIRLRAATLPAIEAENLVWDGIDAELELDAAPDTRRGHTRSA